MKYQIIECNTARNYNRPVNKYETFEKKEDAQSELCRLFWLDFNHRHEQLIEWNEDLFDEDGDATLPDNFDRYDMGDYYLEVKEVED